MTKIYKLAKATDVYVWLCEKCFKARLKKGWELRERKEPPHVLDCQDCQTTNKGN